MAPTNPGRPTQQGKANVAPDEMVETKLPSSGEQLAETSVVPQPTADDKRPMSEGDVANASRRSAARPASPRQAGADPPAQPEKKKKKISQLGDFKLVRKLGKGGMGTVYLATQISLDRHVALKTLSKEFAKKGDFVKRFIREARSMAKLQHQNVVQVYAADSHHGVHYAAIEYIDGQSMQDWMNQLHRLSVGDALHVILVCADAIKHAHDLNMIHRDIKPDNILLTKKGVVKVADFGLAKVLDDDVSMTQSGTGLGTPLYMAPEQARNAKHVDKRSDIYALGSTLYYFLTGELPFRGESTLELIIAKEKGTFISARKLNPEVPERLDLMIDKMIAKIPEHRYDNCAAIIRDIHNLNLASASLSFIDGSVEIVMPGAAASVSVAGRPKTQSPRAERSLTSAEDAARTSFGEESPATARHQWLVQHSAGKKMMITKMTTAQIRAGLKGGTLDLKIRLKKDVKDQFASLAHFLEFDDVAEKRAVRDKAEKRSTNVKSIYAKIDRQESRRKRWRWLRNLTQNVKGLIGLILWLALVGAIIYFAVEYADDAWKWVKDKLKEL